MEALEHYSETIGPYAVEYERVPSACRGYPVYVYRAILDPTRCPLHPLPGTVCGNGETLAEARNAARERLPEGQYNPKV